MLSSSFTAACVSWCGSAAYDDSSTTGLEMTAGTFVVEERSCSGRSVATNLRDDLEHLSCDQKLVILSVPTGVESSRVATSTPPLCLRRHWFLRPVSRLDVRVPELQTGLCAEAEMSKIAACPAGCSGGSHGNVDD